MFVDKIKLYFSQAKDIFVRNSSALMPNRKFSQKPGTLIFEVYLLASSVNYSVNTDGRKLCKKNGMYLYLNVVSK